MVLRFLAPVALLLAVSPILLVFAQEEPLSGVTLELRGKEGVDYRLERRAALRVDEGEAPSAFLSPGPFEAVWRGVLRLDKRERLYFSFEGFGTASLRIGEETVLEAEGEDLSVTESERLRLNGGDHPFEVRYASAPSGAGRLRLFWKGRDFARESIPPKALGHFPKYEQAEQVQEAVLRRHGRFLFATLGCARCHAPENAFLAATAMPEVAATGPSLAGVGSRLETAWLTKWLLDPRAMRPSARMPKTVQSPQEAADLAAYLATLKSEGQSETDAGDARLGGALFAELGCVSCHVVTEGAVPAVETGRLSLLGVGNKYRPGRLSAYLREPGRLHPATRMPDFGLSMKESQDVAAFLRGLAPTSVDSVPAKGDPAKGQDLASARGCVACHDLPGSNGRAGPALFLLAGKTDEGCLGTGALSPVFTLSPEDRVALGVFLAKKPESSLHQRSLPEYAARQFVELRCSACHERDGEPSSWEVFAKEVASWKPKEPEPTPDEENPEKAHQANRTPPDLTFTGEKLRETWTADLLSGKLKDKPRSWMKARMPAFPYRSNPLAKGLSRSCGVDRDVLAPALEGNVNELKKAGETLVNVLCITCHGIGERKPTAVFEGQGINLMQSRERLREEHYLRWMLNPYRINPATIMPKFADEEGKTGLMDLLKGDGTQQFRAAWLYLRDL